MAGSLANYPQATAYFDRAVEVDPRYGDAYYNRGVAYAGLGNRERATDDIRTAARLGHEGARNFLRSQGIGGREVQGGLGDIHCTVAFPSHCHRRATRRPRT
jgi:tetratricopeptide (TPR) repeat protein